MPTKRRMPSRKYYLSSQFELRLNYDEQYYKGSCKTTFKKRFANDKKSFNKSNTKTKRNFQRK